MPCPIRRVATCCRSSGVAGCLVGGLFHVCEELRSIIAGPEDEWSGVAGAVGKDADDEAKPETRDHVGVPIGVVDDVNDV